MDHLTVQLFHKFAIYHNGDNILTRLSKSPKSISVLKFLILNQDRPVPAQELISIFWSEDQGQNPESALKTLISRMRKAFQTESDILKSCIVSDQSAYQWQPPIPCTVDVAEFEELCQEVLSTEDLNGRKVPVYQRIMALYTGDVEAPFATDEWIRGRIQHYHDLYLKVMYRYIRYFREDEDYDSIISQCRMALNIEPFDELLNIELMAALKATNQSSAALQHYRHTTGMYYKYLGLDPSERMLDFYKELIKADLDEEDSLTSIKRRLGTRETLNGAFFCDYSIFKDIYQLQLRNMERADIQMFLALFIIDTIGDEDPEPLVMDKIMRDLLDIIMNCLRKGDIITRYSSTQYAALLPMSSQKDGDVIIARVNRMFWTSHTEPYIKLQFEFTALTQPEKISAASSHKFK